MGKIRFDLMISRDDHSYFRNIFFFRRSKSNPKFKTGLRTSFLPSPSLTPSTTIINYPKNGDTYGVLNYFDHYDDEEVFRLFFCCCLCQVRSSFFSICLLIYDGHSCLVSVCVCRQSTFTFSGFGGLLLLQHHLS